jgi:hypothetical protein
MPYQVTELIPWGFEALDVTAVAAGLTAGVYSPATGPADAARVTLETGSIRTRVDGVAPTATVGTPWDDGDKFWLRSRSEIAAFKAILKTGAASAKIQVEYFKFVLQAREN